jgi:hypothetical protein
MTRHLFALLVLALILASVTFVGYISQNPLYCC